MSVRSMVFHLHLAAQFVRTYFRSRLEYRQAFIMRFVIQAVSRSVELLAIWILLHRFEHIQGWTFYEIMLLFAMSLLSYGLAGLILHGPALQLEDLILRGDFDSVLVMPVRPLFYLAARHFNAAFLGHILLGLGLLLLSLDNLGIDWSLRRASWLAVVTVGAALIQGAIMLAAGSASFWLVRSRALLNTALYGVRGFAVYPISIYDRFLQILLTLVLPFAFVSYFPAEALLGKAGASIFPASFQWGTPLVGLVLFVLSSLLWSRGIDRYQSTGS